MRILSYDKYKVNTYHVIFLMNLSFEQGKCTFTNFAASALLILLTDIMNFNRLNLEKRMKF